MMSCLVTLFVYVLCQLLYILGQSESRNNNHNHECLRTCEWPPQPKTCVYNFDVDWFYSMSKACQDCPINKTHCDRQYCIPLNGVARPVAVVNKILPGPKIQVCENDTIVVNVINYLDNAEGTSIHWHGIHQRGTQYMDGVSMVTQCPITTHTTFTYTFQAAPYGTHWWHAHSGFQRADGVFGAMVFRQAPQADVNSALYDFDLPEHVVAVHDWFDEMTLARYTAHRYAGSGHSPDSFLINGKGQRQGFENHHGEMVYTDREIFNVSAGKRYRFRMFSNAIVVCPLKISVDSHKLTIIASDGASLQPYETDSFVIHGGERFDFILEANQDVGSYWMRVQGLADCSGLEELAQVKYEGALNPPQDEPEPGHHSMMKTMVNPWREEPSATAIPIVDLNSAENDDTRIQGTADVVYYIGMDFNRVNKYFEDPGADNSHSGGHPSSGHSQPLESHTTVSSGHNPQHDISTTQSGHNPDAHDPVRYTTGHGTITEPDGHGEHNPDAHNPMSQTTQAHGQGHGGQGTMDNTTPSQDGHMGHDSEGHDMDSQGHAHNPMSQTTQAHGQVHGGHGTMDNTTPSQNEHMGHDSEGHDMESMQGQTDVHDTSGHGNAHAGHHLHYLYTAQINHMSFKFNSRPPLTQANEIPKEEFCSVDHHHSYSAHCANKYCECAQTINVDLGQVVELVLVDEGQEFEMGHPMHLHGYSFWVVAQGKLGSSTTVEEVMRLDQSGNITRKLNKAVRKDTVMVQDGGYTVIRFVADNPGWWFFHCHLQFHMQDGMSLMIHVGTEKDLPSRPANFPRCGPWPSNYKSPETRPNESNEPKITKYRKIYEPKIYEPKIKKYRKTWPK